MSKLNKHVQEHDSVADKLRDSSITDDNKPDTVSTDLGSPVTPLQTRPSGLTSAATTTTTSGSSRTVSSRVGHTKPELSVPNPSATQSSKSSSPSTAQSSKFGALSAGNSGSAAKSCKFGNPSAGKTTPSAAGSNSPAGGSSSSSPKTVTGNQRAGRSCVTSDSAPGTAKPLGRSTSAPQQPVKILPRGNLFPSGKVQITGMTQVIPKSMVLGPGATSYGYGSIMRGSSLPPAKPTSGSLVISSGSTASPDPCILWKKVITGSNPEEVKRVGNEMFNKSCFNEALKLYERAIELSPTNATYRSNRAAALAALDRIGEAVIECEEAVRLDPNYARAHQRLGALLLRLGHIENAGTHLYQVEEPSDPMLVQILQQVEKHYKKCADARRRGEWKIVLTEACVAMSSGADSSPQLALCKVEALLKLQRLDVAQTEIEIVPKVEPVPNSFSHARFFDMLYEAYTSFVKSQMDLALGRFENAVTAAEKASEIDPENGEIETFYRNVRFIVRACDRGNDLYESERYTEASAAYGEGLKYDPSNATLLCLRAECFFKVGRWESSIEDCNHALLIQSSYKKPLLQRAAAYNKLERWAEAVSDYESLRKKLPYDKEIAESLFHAQVALKKSRGQVVLNMEFGGEVEEMTNLEEFKAALTRPGVSVVHFLRASDQQCKEMSVFMDALCIRYPSLHFLKVEIEKYPAVGDAERVKVVPTFKIYKHGIRMKEIVCPSKEALENSVRNYNL